MQYLIAHIRQICKLKSNFVKVNARIRYILVQILNRLPISPVATDFARFFNSCALETFMLRTSFRKQTIFSAYGGWVVVASAVFLTRAPLGYFYNAPHWGGGGGYFEPPSDLRNYSADSKNSRGI